MPNAMNAEAEHKQTSTPDYVQGIKKIRGKKKEKKNKSKKKMGRNGRQIKRNAGGRGRGTQEDQPLSETRRQDQTKTKKNRQPATKQMTATPNQRRGPFRMHLLLAACCMSSSVAAWSITCSRFVTTVLIVVSIPSSRVPYRFFEKMVDILFKLCIP